MSTIECLEKFMMADIISRDGMGDIRLNGNLLDQGVIDSLGIMKLVVFMEENFHIKIADEEIIPDNFQSLDCMVDFINQKSAGA